MKILIIANSIVGGFTGGESRFIELAKIWQKQGHEIHIMTSRAGKMLCERTGLNVTVHEMSSDTMTGRLTFILRTLKLPFVMGKIKEFSEGLVYSANEQIYDILPALYLKLKYKDKIKWATVIHWLPPILFWKRKASKWYNALMFLISERLSVYLAGFFGDVLLPVGESTKKALMETYIPKSKIKAVDCGVNFDLIQTYIGKEKKYDAIFMKRLQESKGIFDVIDIWAEVAKAKEDAQLLIVGNGCDHVDAVERMLDYGLIGNITFKDTIYDNEKYKILSEAKMLLHPSYEENWSIIIGEAFAMGLPVIAYDLSDIHDIWHENCIWIDMGDKKKFVKEILYLLKQDKERNIIGEINRSFIYKYDWKNIAKTELSYCGCNV